MRSYEGFAERIESASVLHIDIRGFSHHAEMGNPETAIHLFNQLIGIIDVMADEHLMDPIKTVGENYVIACGLSVSRLDHAKRSVDFACALVHRLETFSQKQGTELSMRVGIHCGPVLAGVVGEKRFSYDLWGNTVDVAGRIRYEADPNSIIITQQVHSRLDDSRTFDDCTVLTTRALGDLNVWSYSPLKQPDEVTRPSQIHQPELVDKE